jgi:hypothetical protein
MPIDKLVVLGPRNFATVSKRGGGVTFYRLQDSRLTLVRHMDDMKNCFMKGSLYLVTGKG